MTPPRLKVVDRRADCRQACAVAERNLPVKSKCVCDSSRLQQDPREALNRSDLEMRRQRLLDLEQHQARIGQKSSVERKGEQPAAQLVIFDPESH
jgi:hypothetical protein